MIDWRALLCLPWSWIRLVGLKGCRVVSMASTWAEVPVPGLGGGWLGAGDTS